MEKNDTFKMIIAKHIYFTAYKIIKLFVYLLFISYSFGGVYANSVNFYNSNKFISNNYNKLDDNSIISPPIARNDLFIIYQNQSLSANLFVNNGFGADDLGTTPTFLSAITFPIAGFLNNINSSGNFTYTPFLNFFGIDTFTYTIKDDNGFESTATVTIIVIKVPIARNDNFTILEDTFLNGNVLGNNGNGIDELGVTPTTVTSNTNPSNGTVVMNSNGTFLYTPNPNFNGIDTFTYTITDDNGNSSTATVTITVTPVNDLPIITSPPNYTTLEDTPLTATVVATDVDGNTLTFTVTSTTANGTLVMNSATGVWIYTPNLNFNGTNSFTVSVSDGNGGIVTQVITITVTPVNDLPIITSPPNYTTLEDTPLTATVVATDVDGNILTFTVTSTTANGTLVMNSTTGVWTYTPNLNFNGTNSFTVSVSDGNGGIVTQVITITVTPVNDLPIITSPPNYTTLEDTPLTATVVATDVDGNILTFTVTSTTANGTLVMNSATGVWTYTPNLNFNGTNSFTVSVSDGNGGIVTQVITITVTPVNDLPIITSPPNYTTLEDTPLTATVVATDVDGNTLTFTVTSTMANGTLVMNSATGVWTYTPNLNFNGTNSFTVSVSDGNGGIVTQVITITVTPVNDVPIITSPPNYTTLEDTPLTATVVATDVDGNTLTFTVTSTTANGTLVMNSATGVWTYTPNLNFNGTNSFTVQVSDGNGGIVTQVITITVTPVNDVPIITSPPNYTTLEDTPLTATVVATDVDGNTLTFTVTSTTANGTLVMNSATGVWTYTPNLNFNGTNSFTVQVSDGNGGIVTQIITILVTPKNTPIIDVMIPQGFSPNNDGINDTFEILGLVNKYPNFKIEIFNRWGNKLYEYKHNGNSMSTPLWWDGTLTHQSSINKEKGLASGTYFYVIYFNDNSTKPISGWVYLNR